MSIDHSKVGYTCPCCGFIVFSEPPGSYDICPICFWEDDDVQLRFPLAGGANKVCLIEAQKNFLALGVCEERLQAHVRKPTSDDLKDPYWRLLTESDYNDSTGMPSTGMEYFLCSGEVDKSYYWERA
jgi:hypothetical protein